MNHKIPFTILVLSTILCMNGMATEYFTEEFNYDFDLNGVSLTFTADGSSNYYGVSAAEAITELPYDVGSETGLILGDDEVTQYSLNQSHGQRYVYFFGSTKYGSFRISSNGFITFNEGSITYSPTIAEHFSLPRIALYWTDLDPRYNGRVVVSELTDRVVITYKDVPRFSNNTNLLCNAQCELFYYADEFRLSWINTDNMGYTIVGLSDGSGTGTNVPADYVESDLSAFLHPSNDMDEDGLPDDWENFYFTSYTNCAPNGHGDSDGFDNESEYIAGTDPTDPNSYFAFSFGLSGSAPNPNIIMNWNCLTGRTYTLMHNNTLSSPFTNLATGIVYPQNSYTSTVGSVQSSGFFKVGVEMTP